jgi:ribonuclease III
MSKKVEKLLLAKYAEQNLEKLEQVIEYNFDNKLLLVKSLSHPSLKQLHDFKLYFLTQKLEFEKLEFLGDAVLNLAVAHLLIDLYPRSAEGTLAKFKNHLVSKKILSKVAIDINLANFILITEGEKKSGGKTNLSNLENALESLLGAIYLEAGMQKTSSVIAKLLNAYIKDMASTILDPKSSLQEMAHSMDLGLPVYAVTSKTGSDNQPLFEIEVSLKNAFSSTGEGKSKKEAEINAAKKLLAMLTN